MLTTNIVYEFIIPHKGKYINSFFLMTVMQDINGFK